MQQRLTLWPMHGHRRYFTLQYSYMKQTKCRILFGVLNNTFKFYFLSSQQVVRGRDHAENLGVDGRIILECKSVSKSFRTGFLEREMQMVQLSATTCSCNAILWVSLVSFAAITLCTASQRVFVGVYFVMDSVRKLLDTPSYVKETG